MLETLFLKDHLLELYLNKGFWRNVFQWGARKNSYATKKEAIQVSTLSESELLIEQTLHGKENRKDENPLWSIYTLPCWTFMNIDSANLTDNHNIILLKFENMEICGNMETSYDGRQTGRTWMSDMESVTRYFIAFWRL